MIVSYLATGTILTNNHPVYSSNMVQYAERGASSPLHRKRLPGGKDCGLFLQYLGLRDLSGAVRQAFEVEVWLLSR